MILNGANAVPNWNAVRRAGSAMSWAPVRGGYYRRGFITYVIYTA